MQGIPDKLNNFKVYENGSELIGIVDAELPSFEALSEAIAGAGIAGEIDSPNVGHFGPMSVVLNWRIITARAAVLSISSEKMLDIRGSLQEWNPVKGLYEHKPLKVTTRGIPKKLDPGKLEVGKQMDTATELEVLYIKIMIQGRSVVELDKLNFKYKVGGVDLLQPIKSNLGM